MALYDKISAVEIHPSCIPDNDFLQRAIYFCKETSIPLILGISGFSFDEIEYLMDNNLKNIQKNQLLFMYGFQNYPTLISSIQLNRIKLFQDKFRVKVAYADHTEYDNDIKDSMIAMAYGMGLNIIELHYVLSFGKERTDYIAAYDSKKIIEIRDKLLLLKQALGEMVENMNEFEKAYSLKFRKIPVYSDSFPEGHVIMTEDIRFKRSNVASQFLIYEIKDLIGRTLIESVVKDQEITLRELE